MKTQQLTAALIENATYNQLRTLAVENGLKMGNAKQPVIIAALMELLPKEAPAEQPVVVEGLIAVKNLKPGQTFKYAKTAMTYTVAEVTEEGNVVCESRTGKISTVKGKRALNWEVEVVNSVEG